MMDIKLTTFRKRLFSAFLAGKSVSMFSCLAGFFPRTEIIEVFAATPRRTIFPCQIFRPPLTIANMTTEYAYNAIAGKFIFLAIKRFSALSTHYFFACSRCFHTLRTTVFARFLACDMSIDSKRLAALLTRFLDFRLSLRVFHVLYYSRVVFESQYNSGMGRFTWRKLNGDA